MLSESYSITVEQSSSRRFPTQVYRSTHRFDGCPSDSRLLGFLIRFFRRDLEKMTPEDRTRSIARHLEDLRWIQPGFTKEEVTKAFELLELRERQQAEEKAALQGQ